jgi:hypothetical protein
MLRACPIVAYARNQATAAGTAERMGQEVLVRSESVMRTQLKTETGVDHDRAVVEYILRHIEDVGDSVAEQLLFVYFNSTDLRRLLKSAVTTSGRLGATPMNLNLSWPLPAAIDATCVPCPWESR